ncbi:Indole-3-acetic acid-amido synthetase GH3.6 [Heracleum sosnowskyi]|uniref:Indole-3-acetic acid-amido synthetase GH3.6 n=1 Tax=Heracleum sosnowskyi TaxID=360622 RepID=A0AAD8LXQ0_9APIA|nr:Indole-3-acetic acid-amido synthetase GH3.6 [Heracleum sosnowskyi]
MECSSVMKEKEKKALEFIEHVTTNADVVQKQVLAEILTRNAGVEYLQRHGLGGRTDTNSFKKLVPVITYEDIQPDINRIANGDKSPILCSHPISEFLTSSGTSGGERKLIPTIEEELDRKEFFYSLLMPIMNKYIPGLDQGKAMFLLFIKSESKTPGGLLARSAVTSYFRSTKFINRSIKNDPYTNYTSPNETILCLDNHQSMYSQILCGLCLHEEVVRVGAIFGSGLIRAIQFLENNWMGLCNDIRTGTLNPEITDQLVRESVMEILKPDPFLADFIEAECGKKSWKGIITRLWPNTKCIETIVTGTMSSYIPTLEYYCNGLPLVSSLYASSEAYFGVNLNPLCEPSEASYTLIPTLAYFEFLPMQRNKMVGDTSSNPVARSPLTEKEQEELVDLVDVKLGEEYELVVTTYAGLYRYKVGDILRVAGFKNKAPRFNFICRKNVVLSIEADKTDEDELQSAVEKAVINHLTSLNVNLVDYTAYADKSTVPGHYVIFCEYIVHNNESTNTSLAVPPSIFEDCCLAIEESLNSVYRQGRVADKSIGPLEIKIVERGTFNELMDFAVSLGASVSQYKTPRSVKIAPILDLLNSKAVSNHYSPRCPKWAPRFT